MSRLIDADKLIEDVLNSMPTGSARGVFRAFIEEQPTAFDVDKLVSELERKRDYHYKQMEEVDFENDIYAQHIFDEEHNRGIGLNEAIEIVKAGGV